MPCIRAGRHEADVKCVAAAMTTDGFMNERLGHDTLHTCTAHGVWYGYLDSDGLQMVFRWRAEAFMTATEYIGSWLAFEGKRFEIMGRPVRDKEHRSHIEHKVIAPTAM